MTEPTELFIAHGLWHLDEARTRAMGGMRVVCFDFLVEREFKKQKIPCISLRDIIDSETGEGEWWLLAQDVAREWYRVPAMKFFEYEGIRIGESIEPIMMEAYLFKLFYYVRIYLALKKAYPSARLSIPLRIVEESPTDDCLAHFERRAIIDAARMTGFESTVLESFVALRTRGPLRSMLKKALVSVYNTVISLMPHRAFKIYASEYWSHIGTVIEGMKDTELILMDSGELKHIPWRQLLIHRIRTRRPADEVRGEDRKKALRISREFMTQWEIAKEDVSRYLSGTRSALDWRPLLEAFEYLMTYAPRVITEIDALRRIMTEEKPDVVLQLASISDRHHQFFLMARVAALLKVPSVELQHASAYIDPRAVFSRLETDCVATYGTDTNSWRERIGHARPRLRAVGSPRFDRYVNEHADMLKKGRQLCTRLGLDTTRPILLAAVPYESENLFALDSYQLAEFFNTIRMVQNGVHGLQVLFKCRNHRYIGSVREHLRGLFHTDYAIAGDEDIAALLGGSDAVVCSNSTLIYQTVLAKKPLVLYPWKYFDTYHAQVYSPFVPLARTDTEAADMLVRVFAEESYRKDLLTRQKRFLEGYLFDGRSFERVAALLREVSRTKNDDRLLS